jgi:hypothetical protein
VQDAAATLGGALATAVVGAGVGATAPAVGVEAELEQADATSAATETNATALRLMIIEILTSLRVRGTFPFQPTASDYCAGPSSSSPPLTEMSG